MLCICIFKSMNFYFHKKRISTVHAPEITNSLVMLLLLSLRQFATLWNMYDFLISLPIIRIFGLFQVQFISKLNSSNNSSSRWRISGITVTRTKTARPSVIDLSMVTTHHSLYRILSLTHIWTRHWEVTNQGCLLSSIDLTRGTETTLVQHSRSRAEIVNGITGVVGITEVTVMIIKNSMIETVIGDTHIAIARAADKEGTG